MSYFLRPFLGHFLFVPYFLRPFWGNLFLMLYFWRPFWGNFFLVPYFLRVFLEHFFFHVLSFGLLRGAKHHAVRLILADVIASPVVERTQLVPKVY